MGSIGMYVTTSYDDYIYVKYVCKFVKAKASS